LVARVAAQLESIVRPSARLVAGLSGGADSIVLLDCLQRAARKLRFRLSALHVNHQLSPNAGRWAAFCRSLCRSRGIPFESVKVLVGRRGGLEAAARAARYAVFARQDCDYIVLAHHGDDQVETLLLQLLRGAGVKGLAAMPFLRDEGGGRRAEGKSRKSGSSSHPDGLHPIGRSPARTCAGTSFETPGSLPHPSSLKILRPMLDVTRREILDYARERGLKWIEDESNLDARFLRNFLRQEVLPAIERRFPAYRTTVARAARHQAEAAGLLDEMAAADGAGQIADGSLAVQALRRLPRARARNLLRYFLDSHGLAMPGTERLEEALRQALAAKDDAKVSIELDGAYVRRFGGRLYVVDARSAPAGFSRRWDGKGCVDLPELGGTLELRRLKGRGISLARLRGAAVTVRLRQGGERIQPDCRRPRRSLKNLLQEARVPPWLRERMPLIFHGETLAWVPGIGVDCAFQAGRGEAAVMPVWSPLRQP
jgi:tRNA(Ile)-lysidine synthase